MASDEQRKVEKFHIATGSTVGTYPAIRDAELRMTLIQEEVDELFEAIEVNDIAAVAKEIADILYVVHGTSVSFGIDMEPVFNAVHENNMTKVGGGIRKDGKIMKPEGYKKVDIRQLVINQTPPSILSVSTSLHLIPYPDCVEIGCSIHPYTM